MFILFDYEAFRLKLILHRRNLRLTQEELGELSGISDKHISQIELGKHIPKLKTIISLLNAFNTNVSSFMSGESDTKKVIIENIDKYLSEMSEKDKKFILELTKELNKGIE